MVIPNHKKKGSPPKVKWKSRAGQQVFTPSPPPRGQTGAYRPHRQKDPAAEGKVTLNR